MSQNRWRIHLDPNIAASTKKLLRKYGIKLRKRLSQNFVVDGNLIDAAMELAAISKRDKVLEVGAGLGTLTRVLGARAKYVQAVEVDPRLFQCLRDELEDLSNVEIINSDILELSLPDVDVIVSNVPYGISSPLLLKILESPTWRRAVLTLQEGFAARLVANPGTKEYGRLTLAAFYYADVKLHRIYPPESFYPAPEVSSQMVELHRRMKPPIQIDRAEIFWTLTRLLFTQRNRLLSKALKTLAKGSGLPQAWSQVLAEASPERLLSRRVRELDPADFAALSDLVSSRAEVGLG